MSGLSFSPPTRTMVRVRRWSSLKKSYGPWSEVDLGAEDESGRVPLELRRGGTITFCKKYLLEAQQRALVSALSRSKLFRQYKFGNVPEPRVHMLLAACGTSGRPSSPGESSPAVSYHYHGVRMVASPVHVEPEVARLARRTSAAFEGADWNVGVDVVCYRDGQDSVGWHSDDTQGETLVVATVVESQGGPRRIAFRPKEPRKTKQGEAPVNSKHHVGEAELSDGDEEVELWISQGDTYAMDRGVQVHYEHCVPKRRKSEGPLNGRRIVVIMRRGDLKLEPSTAKDSGEPVESLEAPLRRCQRTTEQLFGHPFDPSIEECVNAQGVLDETKIYSREELVEAGAHASTQRGVAGVASRGAESLVVSRQAPEQRECDGIVWLRYTSTRRGGANALFESMLNQVPVRIFRSSSLASPFAPPNHKTKKVKSEHLAAVYRYDGLYRVARAWDPAGTSTLQPPPLLTFTGDKRKRISSNTTRKSLHESGEQPAITSSGNEDDDNANDNIMEGTTLTPNNNDESVLSEPAYTFRLVRIDGSPNACTNEAFARALFGSRPSSTKVPPLVDEVLDSLPPLSLTAAGIVLESKSQEEIDEVTEIREGCAVALVEIVDMIDAHFSGAFSPENAPACIPLPAKKPPPQAVDANVDQRAAALKIWLAHRRLFWRFARFAPDRLGNCPGETTLSSSEPWATPQGSRRVTTMVAAAAARSNDRDIAAAIAAREPRPDLEKMSSSMNDDKCALCGKGPGTFVFSPELEVDLGDLRSYGEISSEKTVSVHETCRSTSAEVYSDYEQTVFYNVVSAVKRGKQMKCALGKKCLCRPKLTGATVGCAVARCSKTYHYACALSTNWSFGPNQNFWCQKHRVADHDPHDIPEEEDDDDNMDVVPDDDDDDDIGDAASILQKEAPSTPRRSPRSPVPKVTPEEPPQVELELPIPGPTLPTVEEDPPPPARLNAPGTVYDATLVRHYIACDQRVYVRKWTTRRLLPVYRKCSTIKQIMRKSSSLDVRDLTKLMNKDFLYPCAPS